MTKRNESNGPGDGLNLESLMETLFYRDEFLSIAGHELRTPLTTLKLHVQVFKRKAIKESESHYSKEKIDHLVAQIDSQTSRLIKLVDDMLDITRLRSGKFIMTKKRFNLSELLTETVHHFCQNEFPHVTLKSDANIFIYGDRDRIAQVFNKLLVNAARYGKGLPVEVKLVQRQRGISFSIKDQGQGVSVEDQKRIFHRFQRAVAASEVSGLGLGLYIAREIVEAHSGVIKVKSVEGQGSTFTIEFKREVI